MLARFGQSLANQLAPIADDDDDPLDAAGGKGVEHKSIIGRPATGSKTFGRSDFIRVPLPAAKTTAMELVMMRDPKAKPADRETN